MPWGPEDWDAWTLYRRTESERPPLQDEILRDMLAKLPGRRRMTVADLGCGRGSLLPFLASHFRRVVAVDYAPATLAAARGTAAGLGVEFRRRDLRDLTPFRNRLHVAVAVDSIVGPRRADVDRVLEQVHQSLVEGGLLLATFPAAPRSGPPRPVALEGLGEDGDGEGPLRFTEAELQYRLRRAGFRGLRIRRFPGGPAPDGLLCLAVRRANN